MENRRIGILLAFSFISYWIALIFAVIGKVIFIVTESPLSSFYGTGQFWILSRITQFRFTFSFMILCYYLLFLFEMDLFELKHEEIRKQVYLIIGIIFIAFCFITVFSEENYILDIIAFLLTSIYALMALIPLILDSYGFIVRKKSKQHNKRDLVIIGLMALFILISFIFMIIDRITAQINSVPTDTSIYSNIGWISTTIGMIITYLGYFLAKRGKKKI